MPINNKALQAQLRQLNNNFRIHASHELSAILELADMLNRKPVDSEPILLELRNRLHKIAGSAGTFGLKTLGENARILELQIKNSPIHELDRPARRALIAGLQQLSSQLAVASVPPTDSTPVPVPASDTNLTERRRRIFLLESNETLSDDICNTLNSFGYETLGFSRFSDLSVAIEAGLPDALIIDFSLIDQPALVYLKDLHVGLSESLPLIALADDHKFTKQLQAVRAGAQGFFTKPVDLPALENRLESCFNKRHSEPFRVLIIDDDHALAARFEAVLRGSDMLVEVLLEPTGLLNVMARFAPDVVLMDVNMPDYSGPELAQIIRLNDDWLRVPIIYLSAETDTRLQMAALIKAGDDFITKPISDSDLLNAVFSRAQRARRMGQALARDSLTGLLKHADIKDQVVLEVERSVRTRQPVSVAMIDIDLFKSVNDKHGHGMGDNVIRALANLLRQRLRKIDRLGRYGGEEFVAVLPACNAVQAQHLLDEIRRDFNTLQFNGADGLFNCSFSAGISACDNPDWWGNDLLEQADKALYRAKNLGRNRVECSRQDDSEEQA